MPGDGALGDMRLEAGLGLYVIGAEMGHDSRIDLQLRGRSGRQGQPGSTEVHPVAPGPPACVQPARGAEGTARRQPRWRRPPLLRRASYVAERAPGPGRRRARRPRRPEGARGPQPDRGAPDGHLLPAPPPRHALHRLPHRVPQDGCRVRAPHHSPPPQPQAYPAATRPGSSACRRPSGSTTGSTPSRYGASGRSRPGGGLTGLMEERVLRYSGSMPLEHFEEQAKRLMLSTSDSIWSDHLVQLDGMVAGIPGRRAGPYRGRLRIRTAQRRDVAAPSRRRPRTASCASCSPAACPKPRCGSPLD